MAELDNDLKVSGGATTVGTTGEAHGHPHSLGPVCYLSAFPSSEVGLPHVFSKQLSDLSSAEPENNKF
jgi:hypothetical protein